MNLVISGDSQNALSGLSLSGVRAGQRIYWSLARDESNPFTLFEDSGRTVELGQYEGPALWQELPVGPGAEFVSEILISEEEVSFDLSGLLIGDLPEEFDIEYTAVEPENPVAITGTVFGSISIDASLVLEDAEGHIQASVYENDDLQTTRIREGIRRALELITTENGYRYTVIQVLDDPPSSLSDVTEKPAAVSIWGSTKFFSETNYDTAFESLLWVYILAEEQSNTSLATEGLVADVTACIGRNPSLPHPDGTETVQRARIDSVDPFSTKDNRPLVGAKIGIRVWWSIMTSDPSIIGSAL